MTQTSDVTFRERTLHNGLKVIAELSPVAQSAAAGFFVRTGARDEEPRLMGVSHFLEHMMFKGTEDLSADEINRAFDDLGARNNAYTSGELTCFHAQVLPEHAGTVIDVLARMMRPAIRQEDFDTEKNVILEEIAMYADNPFWVLYENAAEAHYRGHPLGHRVLGTKETVSAMKRDEMAAYFGHRYSADNTVVALSGRIDFDAACAQIEALCGDWPTTGPTRDNSAPDVGAGRILKEDQSVSRSYLIGLSPGPGVADPDRYAAAIAAQVVGAPDNSLLHWSLIETGIAEEAQSAFEPHDGCGDFFVYASGDPERMDEIEEKALAACAAAASEATDEDLERLRNKIATGATLSGERPNDRMQRIGRLWSSTGSYRSLDEELALVNAVTLADVRRVLEQYPMTPATLARLGPPAGG